MTKILKCKACCGEFIFTEEQQNLYKKRGFVTPKRCKACRKTEKVEEDKYDGWWECFKNNSIPCTKKTKAYTLSSGFKHRKR